jgi:hypothetical protein
MFLKQICIKWISRAKNLGLVLDSKEIAQGISKKYNLEDRLPRYTQVNIFHPNLTLPYLT